MIKQNSLQQLYNKKNLLAFSAGVDSTTLFFILIQKNITFDIAIVDYNLRDESKKEVAYAKRLALKYNLTCHHLSVDKIKKNLEANARIQRYNFFEKLIKEYHYDNLITAHHLGDRFEWMLMQFCKGAGCAELSGMQTLQKRDNYTLVRPLLHLDKQELLEYLHQNNIQYFEDSSNEDTTIKRNEFRHNYSKPLLKKYLSGIKKSFEYLDEDKSLLIQDIDILNIDDFAYFKSTNIRNDIYTIDKYIKSCGHIIRSAERELLKTQKTIILGRKFIVNYDKNYVFILPYTQEVVPMDETFKNECRLLKIEPKIRQYLSKNKNAYALLKSIYHPKS